MSETISNIRNVPTTHPIKPVVQPDRDRKPSKQDIDREKPDETADDPQDPENSENAGDQDQPLLDEYV